jgi:hypothetical protein
MTDWAAAGDVPEFRGLLSQGPPVPPIGVVRAERSAALAVSVIYLPAWAWALVGAGAVAVLAGVVVVGVLMVRGGTSPRDHIVGTWRGVHPDNPWRAIVFTFDANGRATIPAAATGDVRRLPYAFNGSQHLEVGRDDGGRIVRLRVEFPSSDELVLYGPENMTWRLRRAR